MSRPETPSRASIYREALEAAASWLEMQEPNNPEYLAVCIRALPIPEEKDEGCNFDNLCDDCRRAIAERAEENPDER